MRLVRINSAIPTIVIKTPIARREIKSSTWELEPVTELLKNLTRKEFIVINPIQVKLCQRSTKVKMYLKVLTIQTNESLPTKSKFFANNVSNISQTENSQEVSHD